MPCVGEGKNTVRKRHFFTSVISDHYSTFDLSSVCAKNGLHENRDTSCNRIPENSLCLC